MRRRIIYLAIAASAIALLIVYKLYNKPHADLRKTKPVASLTTSELKVAFENDEVKANADFLNKVLEVKGKLVEIRHAEGNVQMVLDAESELSNVVCAMDARFVPPLDNFQIGEVYIFRGICAGKLMDIVLNQCILVKN